MTVRSRIESPSDVRLRARTPKLLIDVLASTNPFVIHVTGELDRATRDQLVNAATDGPHPRVTIDLGGVTFMDCSGYNSLTTCRRTIESEGGALTITGQTGQPARLFELIAGLEKCPLRPARTIGRLHDIPSALDATTPPLPCGSPSAPIEKRWAFGRAVSGALCLLRPNLATG